MFKNKVIVITGAGSGIGRALAEEFSKHGARLALADINSKTLAETITLIPKNTEARAYTLDVSSREAVETFAKNIKKDFGAVHFVINNAGISLFASVEHVTYAEIEKTLSTNLWGVIYGTKEFLPIMLEQKEGCIVNISSVFGLVTAPCSVAYSISKFGVRALTETLWQEIEGTGVRAVLVHPGGIDTNIKDISEESLPGDFERKVARGNAKLMTTTPADCAKEIVKGLVKGDRRLLVGSSSKTLYLLSRILPNTYGRIVRKKLGL